MLVYVAQEDCVAAGITGRELGQREHSYYVGKEKNQPLNWNNNASKSENTTYNNITLFF